MRKWVLFFLLVFVSFSTYPKSSHAVGSVLCNMCPEACGGSSGTIVSSKENFRCHPAPPETFNGVKYNTFKICKDSVPTGSSACEYYEKFYWTGSGNNVKIFYGEDTTWATGNGKDVTGCGETLKLVRRDANNPSQPLLWIDNTQTCTASTQILIGVGEESGNACPNAPFTNNGNPVPQSMCRVNNNGCKIELANGDIVDPLIYNIAAGPGATEKYVYYNNGGRGGWVGFTYPNSCDSNFGVKLVGCESALACNNIGSSTSSPPPQTPAGGSSTGNMTGTVSFVGNVCTVEPIANPANSPDLATPETLGAELVPGADNTVGYGGDTDPAAPKLNSMVVNGSSDPNQLITAAYHIPGEKWPVNQVALGSGGEQIAVPQADYRIDQAGHQAMVLRASANEIVIKYTREDNVANGYTLVISNLNVSEAIRNAYNNSQRSDTVVNGVVVPGSLPALNVSQFLGIANNGGVRVAIRDKGTFLDPRSSKDFWTGDTISSAAGGPIDSTQVNRSMTNCEPPPSATSACAIMESVPPINVETFRPAPCTNCSRYLPAKFEELGHIQQTNGLIEISAGFTIVADMYNDRPLNGIVNCGPAVSNACSSTKLCMVRNWGGVLTLDPDEAQVPFAGFGKSDTQVQEVDRPHLRYLADYFDGVSYYGGQVYDASKDEDKIKAYSEGGVLRRLTSSELQDELKRDFIYRMAKSKGFLPPHDYRIKAGYKTTSGGDGVVSELMSAFIVNPHSRFAPLKSDFAHLAVNERGSAYQKAMSDWTYLDPVSNAKEIAPGIKPGRWFLLWNSVPLVSREDSPGKVFFEITTSPGSIGRNDNESGGFQLNFPHLARTYESSYLVNKILQTLQYQKEIAADDLLPIPGTYNKETPRELAELPNDSMPEKNYSTDQPDTNIKFLADARGGNPPTGCGTVADFVPTIRITNQQTGEATACWSLVTHKTQAPGEPAEIAGEDGYADGCHWRGLWSVNGVDHEIQQHATIGNSCLYFASPGQSITTPKYHSCKYFGGETLLPGGERDVQFTFSVVGFGGEVKNTQDERPDKFCAPMFKWNPTCKIRKNPKTNLYEALGCSPADPPSVPPAQTACGNNIFFNPELEPSPNAIEDDWNKNGKLDLICTSPNPISARATVMGDQIPIPSGPPGAFGCRRPTCQCDASCPRFCGPGTPDTSTECNDPEGLCWEWGHDPVPQQNGCGGAWEFDAGSSRQIGMKVTIPYLQQIWDNTKEILKTRATQKDGTNPVNMESDYRRIMESDIFAKTRIREIKYSNLSASALGVPSQLHGGSSCSNCSSAELFYPHLGSAACAKIAIMKSAWAMSTDPQSSNMVQAGREELEDLWAQCLQMSP